jgi:hypothetical protein
MIKISFLDEVAAVGREILTSLGGRADVSPFLRRTRDVYQLLIDIHDDIITTTVEVGTAKTLGEGKRVARSLHHDALESVFRARRWCDELQALGDDLNVLPAGVQIDDIDTWEKFTVTLKQREGDVARLYEEALWEVISRAEQATSLAELKSYIDSVSDELVMQKAKFDLLARRAAALARKR